MIADIPLDDGSIAVIVVHGVADQKPGETAQAVSQQLAAIHGARMVPFSSLVTVAEIESAASYPMEPSGDWKAELRKALAQSVRSDFGAQGAEEGSPPARATLGLDLGARFTDYLFWKSRHGKSDTRPGRGDRPHEVASFAIVGKRIEVFEMFWADLSRLSGAAPRVLTELFTLLFNLSRLGAQTVAIAAASNSKDRVLRWLSGAQRAADWLYSRIFATIVLQLIVCAAMLFAATTSFETLRVIAWAVGIGGPLLLTVYFALRRPAPGSLLATTVVGVAVIFVVVSALRGFPEYGCLAALWLVGVLAVQALLFAYWERRFRGVFVCGMLAAVATFALGVWGVVEHGGANPEAWVFGTLRVVDVMLWAIVFFWFVMPWVLSTLMVCGSWAIAKRGDPAGKRVARNTVGTGRLGLLLSLGAFMAFGQVFWGVIDSELRGRVFGVEYRPVLLAASKAADLFLEVRYENATVMFSLIALCVALVVLQLALTLLPSIVLELRLTRADSPNDAQRWLTRGYALFDHAIGMWAYLFLFVIWLGVVVTTMRVLERYGVPMPSWFCGFYGSLHELSGKALAWVVYPLVGTATSVIVLGGTAWKWLKRVRAPVDIVLDVDNHFREFPRHGIPRVMIFERYLAVMSHVFSRGYRRVLIVAHSQGTVITADFLRYVRQRSIEANANDPVAILGNRVAVSDVRLLTVGSPLRQLYARRFPKLYQWVEEKLPDRSVGPCSGSLGLTQWMNRWGAADYVGRWLWERDGKPLVGEETDSSIGSEAHTHYFECSQTAVIKTLAALTAPKVAP